MGQASKSDKALSSAPRGQELRGRGGVRPGHEAKAPVLQEPETFKDEPWDMKIRRAKEAHQAGSRVRKVRIQAGSRVTRLGRSD